MTLLEILLAVTLLAVMLAAAAGMISGVLGGVGTAGRSIEYDNMTGEIEDIIADDLAFLVEPTKEGSIAIKEDGPGSWTMSFYSACGPKAAWGETPVTIHRVSYQVKPLVHGGKGLFRGEEPLVVTQEAYYDEPLLLAEGVSRFEVAAFDGKEWQGEWPVEGGGPLPVMFSVRLELTMSDGSARTVLVESAPGIETAVKPEESRRASGERRASGRASGGSTTPADGTPDEGAAGDEEPVEE